MAYEGVIPPDRWHEPYMTREELQTQIDDGVRISCYVDNNEIVGVMRIQDKTDVELIRHAYVRTRQRNKGHRNTPASRTPHLHAVIRATGLHLRQSQN